MSMVLVVERGTGRERHFIQYKSTVFCILQLLPSNKFVILILDGTKYDIFYLPKLLRVQQYEKYGTTPLQVLTVLQVQVRGSIILTDIRSGRSPDDNPLLKKISPT